MKKTIFHILLILISLILILCVTGIVPITDAVSNISMSDKSISSETGPEYLINENGESYGADCREQSIEPPDLQLAKNAEGIVGYIRTSEIPGAAISSPAEAIKYVPRSGYINLYAKDGKTVIGQFFVG